MLGAGCGSGGDAPAAPPRDRAAGDHLVTVVTAQRVDLGTDQERPGTLRYRKLVRLYSQEEGRVTRLDLYEGDRVSQDQVLVQLEDDLLRAELDKAGATQAQKRLDLRRLEDLQRKRAASDDEVAQAATALALADADLRLLRVRLGYTRIAAPFPGVITERRVEPGDFVTKNTHLLTLADPESLVAEVYASELILPQVRVGDPARLRVDALGASEHAARVLRIHPELEPASRQGIVELVLTPVPAGARAGQFVRVTLKTESRERLILPFRAMHRDREGEFVWLVTPEEKAARQPVRSGLRAAEGVEILEGLDPGARVITRGFLGLTDGKAVKIVAG
jgi:RND family efflux transporter MFP subunit